MTAAPTPETILTDELLERIRDRAAGYDRDNGFAREDLDDLAAAGYLRILVPAELGGLGLDLRAAAACQGRLAAAAPATALAVNMHLVWTGVARLLHDAGDGGLDRVLADAAAGEVLAFGVSEAGNDLVLFGSDSLAEPDGAGGYRFTGTKIFTSLAPAWTRLGVTGLDASDPDDPRIVYAFLDRGDGVETAERWDAAGMRASQSRTTTLRGAHAPADRVVRRVPPGPGDDAILFAIFACFETLVASVYTGLAERALALGVEAATARSSKRTGLPRSSDPDVRRRLADAWVELDGVRRRLDAVAADVAGAAELGGAWFPTLVGLKSHATEAAARVVDQAQRVAGGQAFLGGSELERLGRDVRAGLLHPSTTDAAASTVATWLLGPAEA